MSSLKRVRIELNLNGTEIIERNVSKFGTGAHVIVPKEYSGKKVKVIVEDERRARNKSS